MKGHQGLVVWVDLHVFLRFFGEEIAFAGGVVLRMSAGVTLQVSAGVALQVSALLVEALWLSVMVGGGLWL